LPLLPFIEQDNLYRIYDPNLPFFFGPPTITGSTARNQEVSNTRIPMYLCPAAPPRTGPYTFTIGPINSQAYPADYSPLYGVDTTLAQSLGLPTTTTALAGALQIDARTPILGITDGTSNTVLIAEIAGKRRLYRAGRDAGVDIDFSYGGLGGWNDPSSGLSRLFGSSTDGTITPGNCVSNCSNDFGLYSFHSGGANTLMCDGSVRFLRTSTSAKSVIASITRAGGETLIED
jgi:prepilin-type processing-associated H-X9-DG protein